MVGSSSIGLAATVSSKPVDGLAGQEVALSLDSSPSTITNPFSTSLIVALEAASVLSSEACPFSAPGETDTRKVLFAEAASGDVATSSAFSSEIGTKVPRREDEGVDILCADDDEDDEEEVDEDDSDEGKRDDGESGSLSLGRGGG